MKTSGFRAGSAVNVAKSYTASFGDLPDRTMYSDPLGLHGPEGYDVRPQIAKAWENEYSAIDEIMADGGSFRGAMGQIAVAKGLSVGDLTIPIYPRQELVDLTARKTPFYSLLPKVSAATTTVAQDSVTDLGTAEFGGERGIPDEKDDSFSKQQLTMSYYRVRGAVTGPMQLAQASLRSAMGGEQRRKQTAMAHFAENAVLNGDPQAGDLSGTMTDERGFQGLRSLIPESNTVAPEAGAGSTMTLQEARRAIRMAAKGGPDSDPDADGGGDESSMICLTDRRTLDSLKNDMDDPEPFIMSSNAANGGTVNLGARSLVIDGVPVVVSDFMPHTPYDGGADGTTGREFIVTDARFHLVHNLADLLLEALGKRDDSDEFFMKRYQVYELNAGAERFAARINQLA